MELSRKPSLTCEKELEKEFSLEREEFERIIENKNDEIYDLNQEIDDLRS